MSATLFVGDVHAKVEDLDDCNKLVDRIIEVLVQEKAGSIVFLGDLYDAFAVKNVVVERWWMEALDRIPLAPIDKYLIVGNHDRPGDQSAVGHALQAHGHQAVVVESFRPGPNGIALLPFFFKAEDFVSACNTDTVRGYGTVVAHQSCIGGKYESGQPIEARHDASAVDPAAVPQRCLIMGHIHSPQHSGKVWYVGSPRWRNNVSDANIDRHIVAVDFEGGLPKAVRKYETGDVCKRIWKMGLTEGAFDTKVMPGKEGDRYVVDITGSAAYIEAVKKDLTRPGVRVRTFQTDRPGPKLSEADGVPAAWGKWADEYAPKFGTERSVLTDMARERLAL